MKSFRRFRNFFLIIASLWVVMVIIGLVFSRSLQEKIIDLLIKEANSQLLAEVHLRKSNVHFSLFKKFPYATIELRNLVVKVPEKLDLKNLHAEHGDTLLFARRIYLQLNLSSLLQDEYNLKKISVSDGFLQILYDSKGHSSLDIIRTDGGSSEFSTNIRSLTFNNLKIVAERESSSFQSTIYLKKAEASGTFKESNFSITLKTDGTLEKLKLKAESLEPMQKFKTDVAITRQNEVYSISKGMMELSNIPLRVIGTLRTGKRTLIDLVFSTQDAPIKQIDKSLLSGLIGKTGYEPEGGSLTIQSSVKGYIDTKAPSIQAKFKVENGEIHDRNKDITYQKIFLSGTASNGSSQQQQKPLSVSIDTFNVSSESSNQYGWLKLENQTEPYLHANLKGELALEDIKKFASFAGMEIKGENIHNSITVKGYLPGKDKPLTSQLEISGWIRMTDLKIKFTEQNIPEISTHGTIHLHPDHSMVFDSVYCQAARSRMVINGSLSNYDIPGSIPSLNARVHAYSIYTDDFIPSEKKQGQSDFAIVFPDSIDLHGSLYLEEYHFGKFAPREINSEINYTGKSLELSNFSMNCFSGKTRGNMLITQPSDDKIKMMADVTIEHSNLEEMFNAFNNFGQDVIGREHLNGWISGNIQFASVWSSQLILDPESILAQGDLLIEKGELKDYPPLMGLSRFIDVKELKHIRFDNLHTSLSIRNQKVILDQTKFSSSAIDFEGSGIHDFDNKYEYRLQVGLTDLLWKKSNKSRDEITEFGYLVDDQPNRTTVPFLITGKGTEFDVKYDKLTSRNRFKENIGKEKILLKEMFSDQATNTQQVKTDTSQTKPQLEKTNTGTYQNKTKDFILDWDDSAEEEEDSGGGL
ncbi:MAG: hypothetical protein IPM71_07610 [Bacteroidota bacterium]|nr:MAG: hypothetical protein IPM71_07610 [Bacteroidota bacterium]